MKHAGSQESLLARLASESGGMAPRKRFAAALRRQSAVSWLATLACALMLVAVVADAPVRDLARSLDPSVVSVLRTVTQFGNSAWPLGIGLLLLASVAIVARHANPFAPEALQNLRSAVFLVMGAVAISGFIASLTKNMIGRARPSTGDPQVFEFTALAFQAGWAAFPSGHATTATACAVALATIFPRHAFAWLSIGILASLSRAFIGVHWLTDCLAGMVLGALVCHALRSRMESRGHAFKIDPVLPFQVMLKGASLCAVSIFLVLKAHISFAVLRYRRQFPARKPSR